MLRKLWAGAHANLHVLTYFLNKDPRHHHKIVLMFSPGLDCVSIECSCGKRFWSTPMEEK